LNWAGLDQDIKPWELLADIIGLAAGLYALQGIWRPKTRELGQIVVDRARRKRDISIMPDELG
jgi:hypothetical protein